MRRPAVRHPERAGLPRRLQLVERGGEGRLVGGSRGDAGLLHLLGVVVHAERVHVERDAVTRVVVDPGLPHLRGEVLLGEPDRLGQVVHRHDGLAGGVGGQLVQVHDPDVGPLAGGDRGRHPLVVLRPLHRVGADLDLRVLLHEVGDHLLHERPVATGEAVPVGQGHGGSVVATGERRGRLAAAGGLLRGLAAAAGGQAGDRSRRTADRQELTAGECAQGAGVGHGRAFLGRGGWETSSHQLR